MDDSSNLLKHALIALHLGGTPGPPFRSFNAVNAWLNDFRQTHEAWMACICVYNECESPVLRYSCASLLVRKVEQEWTGLQNPEERERYRKFFLQIYAASTASDTMDTLLIRQIVLLLVLSIDTMQEMMSLLQSACASLGELQHPAVVYASMEILMTLAVEFREESRRSHAVLLPALKEKSSYVMGLLEERMIASQHQDDASRLCSVAKAWIELPSIPGGYNETDIVSFSAQHRVAFDFLLKCCFTHSLESGRDCILTLLKGTSIDEDCVPQEFLVIFHRIASIIIEYRTLIPSGNEVSDCQALVIAHVGSALADCWPDGVAKSMGPGCVDLAKVMIECMKRPEESVIEASLEYFFAMNLTDVTDRMEDLQLPLMTHLVQTIATRLMYPTQDECDAIEYEEDHCVRLRKDLVPELLQELFPALTTWYVEYAVQGMKTNIWQHVEISMYLLQAVDLQIRTQILGNVGSESATSINMMLCDGFQSVSHWMAIAVNQEPGDQVSIVVSQYCRTVQSFSIWFGKVSETPLGDVLTTLITVISFPGEGLYQHCKRAACSAIKALSIRAGERFGKEHNMIHPLLESLKAALALHIPGEDELVEAAVRLSSRLESDAFRNWLVQILRPYAETLTYITSIDTSTVQEEYATMATHSLGIISGAFRCLLSPSKSHHKEHSIATFLFQNLQETLQNLVVSIWSMDLAILDGVILVCKEAISVGGREILQGVVAVLLHMLRCGRSSSASLFDLLSEMIEVHYNDDESMDGIMAISKAAFDHSLSILHGTGILSQTTMVASILNMGYSSLVYAPTKTLETGSFPVCIDLGIAALACRESPEVIVQALELLAYLPCATTDASLPENARQSLEAIILEKGDFMIEALVYSLCETCPRPKVNAVSQLIKSLLTQEPFINASNRWFHNALHSKRVIQSSPSLDESSRSTVITLVTSGTLKPQRLGCMIQDLGLISRKEQGPDVLASYLNSSITY